MVFGGKKSRKTPSFTAIMLLAAVQGVAGGLAAGPLNALQVSPARLPFSLAGLHGGCGALWSGQGHGPLTLGADGEGGRAAAGRGGQLGPQHQHTERRAQPHQDGPRSS